MKIYFGLAMILWGMAIIFVLPDDPKLLNYVIIGTYILAMFWWLHHTSPVDVAYWFFACGITTVVTFGYGR